MWRVIIMLIEKITITLQALAEFEARLKPQGRKVTVVTQNIDGLHHKAGSQDIIELHGIYISMKKAKQKKKMDVLCFSPKVHCFTLAAQVAVKYWRIGTVPFAPH